MAFRNRPRRRAERTRRVSTGAVPAADAVTVTITWATPFADALYTVQVDVLEATAGTTLRCRTLAKTAEAVTVRVSNSDLSARTGELHAHAIHDQ